MYPEHPDYVFKLKKAFNGLKQAPRAWFEHLTNYLVKRRYKRGGTNKIMFVKKVAQYVLIAQIYVDDIVLGSTFKELTEESI